ncbi:hypothetical protein [Anaeromassilibacillus sp. SJQ-5]
MFKRLPAQNSSTFFLLNLVSGQLKKTADRKRKRRAVSICGQQVTRTCQVAIRAASALYVYGFTPVAPARTQERIKFSNLAIHFPSNFQAG